MSDLRQVVSAQVIPPSSLPGLMSPSKRVVVDIAAPPWRGVVRVQTELGVHCSGALIGSRLVLTAAHCLLGPATGKLVRPSSVHVLVGYRGGVYAGHARATAFEIGPGFAGGPNDQQSHSPPDADWALLTLDAALGTPDRVLPLAPRTPLPGTPTMLGGYQQDRAQVILADLSCTVLGLVQDSSGHLLVRHSCSATRGVSGAPLLAATPGEGWTIIGVASAAETHAAGGYAVPIEAVTAAASAQMSR